MKSKFATIIMTIIIILIISVFSLFGFIFWEELKKLETSVKPEDVKTVLSENTNTIDEDIKAPEILENVFDSIQDNDSAKNEVDYSNVTINKYFYNQLEDYAQTIYKAL